MYIYVCIYIRMYIIVYTVYIYIFIHVHHNPHCLMASLLWISWSKLPAFPVPLDLDPDWRRSPRHWRESQRQVSVTAGGPTPTICTWWMLVKEFYNLWFQYRDYNNLLGILQCLCWFQCQQQSGYHFFIDIDISNDSNISMVSFFRNPWDRSWELVGGWPTNQWFIYC